MPGCPGILLILGRLAQGQQGFNDFEMPDCLGHLNFGRRVDVNGNRHLGDIRNWPRYREAANILIKYGYGFIFERFSPRKWWKSHIDSSPPDAEINHPRKLRQMLEELGPTCVKIGQLLSTRPDILGVDYIRELEKLQDEVPPFSQEDLLAVLGREGINVKRDFAEFILEPIAAASIAQVHEAVLKNGERIVLKIQRPGIERIIETDLHILIELSRLAEKRTGWGRLYRISEIAEELAQALRNELDFKREAHNADLFRRNFIGSRNIIIPRVFWQFTSSRILALERVQGKKVQDIALDPDSGFDRKKIAQNLIDALFNQLFEHGFFHADPHPGNIAIAPGEKIIFYDFGQVGIVDEHLQVLSMNLITSMIRYDTDGVARALLQIGVSTSHVDRDEFRRDVSFLQQKYYGLPISQIKVGEALRELLDLSIKYQIRIPAGLSLMVKMLLTVESMVSALDPDISIVDIAEPYGRRLILKRLSHQHLWENSINTLLDLADVARQLPRNTFNLLKIMEEGQLRIKLEHHNLRTLLAKVDIVSNRISLSILLAGIIVGTSLIARQDHTAFLGRIPLVEFGFSAGILLGLFLAYSIIRSGRY